MSGNIGAKDMVTSGLVLHLDAANYKSYITGSTIWNDLTLNNKTGSLTNNPSFNRDKGGSIVFNGSNNYVTLGNNNLGIDKISKSFCAWVYLGASLTNPTGIIDKEFDPGGGVYGGWGFWVQSNRKLWWWNTSNQDILDTGSSTIGTNVWTHIAVTYNATGKTASFYINGTLNSSVTNLNVSENASGAANLLIGSIRNGISAFLNGRIASVTAYNRVLSAAEILQNYNALKGRFAV